MVRNTLSKSSYSASELYSPFFVAVNRVQRVGALQVRFADASNNLTMDDGIPETATAAAGFCARSSVSDESARSHFVTDGPWDAIDQTARTRRASV